MMRLAGMPISQKFDKPCDQAYCQNGYKEVWGQIRNRFF
jgi:hypothetical protein